MLQRAHPLDGNNPRILTSTPLLWDHHQVQSPDFKGGHIGPVVNAKQFEHVQRLIYTGIEEGATLLVGGPGRPAGFEIGYYVRPTLFADVDNSSHTIAREEVFGPVLCIIPFDDEDDAVAIANDTPYGLTSYVQVILDALDGWVCRSWKNSNLTAIPPRVCRPPTLTVPVVSRVA
eukprot:scaffold5715_cov33-Tisochrysis_lutea.AAC.3